MIKFLSPRFGAKVHDKDGTGRTMLHSAAEKGHCDVARYVIEDLKLNPQDRDKVSSYKHRRIVVLHVSGHITCHMVWLTGAFA